MAHVYGTALTLFLNAKNVTQAMMEVQGNIAIIGTMLVALKKPVQADAKAAMPICTKPVNAAAVPALRENGASAIADALGYVRPMHASEIKNMTMVPVNPSQWLVAASKNPSETAN